ncbi:hypothetical protein V8C44DRAFT_58861 [Trichoderma aethiopicum]
MESVKTRPVIMLGFCLNCSSILFRFVSSSFASTKMESQSDSSRMVCINFFFSFSFSFSFFFIMVVFPGFFYFQAHPTLFARPRNMPQPASVNPQQRRHM